MLMPSRISAQIAVLLFSFLALAATGAEVVIGP